MRVKMNLSVLAAAVLLSVPCGAQAAGRSISVQLDPSDTRIGWTLGGVLHTVHGAFQLKDCHMTFDQATGVAQGEVLIDASSGESGNRMRDGKMQKEVLESSRYPEIIFHPEKITGTFAPDTPSDMTVSGTMTLHGADHPLTLKIHVIPHGDSLMVSTRFEVPYVAWGIKDPSTPILRVSKSVTIDVAGRGSFNLAK